MPACLDKSTSKVSRTEQRSLLAMMYIFKKRMAVVRGRVQSMATPRTKRPLPGKAYNIWTEQRMNKLTQCAKEIWPALNSLQEELVWQS